MKTVASKHSLRAIGISIFAAVLIAAVAPTGARPVSAASTTDNTTFNACLQYTNHVYEVCTAYIANSSLAVLWPYYAYAKSPNITLARYVQYRLGSRYTGQANATIMNRVSTWPAGNHEVDAPSIRVLSVNSNLQTNTATIVTQESWRVTDEAGRVIYQENNVRHISTMNRVPSYLLHKWVVSSIR
jgi:hypothetical protein